MFPSRLRRARFVAALASASLVVATIPLAVVAASAAEPQGGGARLPAMGAVSVGLTSGTADVNLGRLAMVFRVTYQDGELGLSLEHTAGTAVELHTWTMKVPASSLASVSSGSWRLAPPSSSTAPLAKVSLTFAATSHEAAACVTGTATDYTGTLKGQVTLTTGLKVFGRLGPSALSFSAPNMLELGHDCLPPTPSTCAPAKAADSAVFMTAGYAVAVQSRLSDSLTLNRITKLGTPKGAVRIDSGTASRRPGEAVTDHSLLVTMPKGSFVSGTLSDEGSGQPLVETFSCTRAGAKHTETIETWVAGTTSLDVVAHLLSGSVSLAGSTPGRLDVISIT